jgi:hypothetical protein
MSKDLLITLAIAIPMFVFLMGVVFMALKDWRDGDE